MTLAADRRGDTRMTGVPPRTPPARRQGWLAYDNKPVEFWPTAAIRAAVESGDLAVWQRIVVALKRDPYGRTARQVEEVMESASSDGITKALTEVLARSRSHLEANERAEVAHHVRALLDRSGLGDHEFASRIGVSSQDLAGYLHGEVSPSASLMVRMRRLSDRFAKIRAQRATRPE
ncbi:XRE family transcriptional regulator [Mycobacterium sp.]|uniref:XRE family transcriptional regulator n=1 Tax=Mycobacterium sp. TaxID=1785 RepID=UPI0039C8DBDB